MTSRTWSPIQAGRPVYSTGAIMPGDLLVTRNFLYLRRGVTRGFTTDDDIAVGTPVVALTTTEDDVMVWTPIGPGWITPSLLLWSARVEGGGP